MLIYKDINNFEITKTYGCLFSATRVGAKIGSSDSAPTGVSEVSEVPIAFRQPAQLFRKFQRCSDNCRECFGCSDDALTPVRGVSRSQMILRQPAQKKLSATSR